MPFFRRSSLLVLGAAVLAGGSGCLSSDTTGTTTPTPVASLRIIQVMGDAGNGVDFSVGGITAYTGVPFGILVPTTGQYAAAPAAAQFAFNATRVTTPFYTGQSTQLLANGYYTIIAYGRVTTGVTPSGTAAVLSDTTVNFLAASPNNVLLRAFDAIDYVTPGSGTAADVYVYPQGQTRPATPTFAAVGYGTRSPYATVAAGPLQIDVLTAGAASTAVPLFSTTLASTGGMVRTLILSDPAPAATTGSAGSVVIVADQQ
ncbi:MAG TPA: hypothetical protein VGD56_10930 [Gemmatirosa sp.]